MSKNKTIQKPLSVATKELQQQIVDAINNSGLPLILSVYILKDVLNLVSETVAQQGRQELADYEAQLAETKKEQSKE